jgi:hypothetical protein
MRIGGLAGSADPFAGLEGGEGWPREETEREKAGICPCLGSMFSHAQAPDEGSGLFQEPIGRDSSL